MTYRGLTETVLWTMPPAQLKVALACVLKANWEDKEWRGAGRPVKVQRGAFVTSFRGLADFCHLSLSSVQRAICALGECEFITHYPSGKFSTILVNEYSDWSWMADERAQSGIQSPVSAKETKETKERKKEPTPPSEAGLDIAQELYNAIIEHTPTFAESLSAAGAMVRKMTRWAHDIDKGLRIDKHTQVGYLLAIDIAHRAEDPFWRPNILSGEKLRKHYDKLQVKRTGTKTASKDERDAIATAAGLFQ